MDDKTDTTRIRVVLSCILCRAPTPLPLFIIDNFYYHHVALLHMHSGLQPLASSFPFPVATASRMNSSTTYSTRYDDTRVDSIHRATSTQNKSFASLICRVLHPHCHRAAGAPQRTTGLAQGLLVGLGSALFMATGMVGV